MKLSATKVGTYQKCPKKYQLTYLEGNWEPPSQPATQGRIAHEAIAKGYEHKLATGKEMDIEEKFEHIDLAFEQDQAIGNTNYRDLVEDVVRETKEMVQLHHDEIAVRTDPFLIEKSFEVDVDGVQLVGIWDLITKDGWIVDNKFFAKTPSQADLDKDIQLSFYSLAYRLLFNEPEKGIRLDCVIKTKNKKTFQIATNRTTEELQWTVNLIKETAKAMETGIYPPNPSGWWCSPRFCGVWEQCMYG